MYKVTRYTAFGDGVDSNYERREEVLNALEIAWMYANSAFVYKGTKLVLAMVHSHKYELTTYNDSSLGVKEHGELYQLGNKWCFATDEGRIVTDLHSCIRDLFDEVTA